MRAAGGIMLALGALLAATRREHSWTSFELLLVFAVPAAALFRLAVSGARRAAHDQAESWRGVLLAVAVLLSLVALFQLLDWVGADTRHLLYDAAVLAVTAVIALVGARRVRAPFVMLLASFALLGAWMVVWIKIFPDPSANTVRWLLLGGGAALLLGSTLGDLAGATGAGELATGGALGLVVAGILGVFVSAFGDIGIAASSLVQGGTGEESEIGGHPALGGHLSGSQTTGWDVYLLAISLVLIVAAARTRRRGPGYVGALGIGLFFASTAAQLVHVESGHARSHSLLGWPLVLLLVGAAGLAAPLLRRREA
jgi:hypothetical protein